MIINDNGNIAVKGDEVGIMTEFVYLTLKLKDKSFKDKELRKIFDEQLLSLYLAKSEKDYLENPNVDKEKLLKKINKEVK